MYSNTYAYVYIESANTRQNAKQQHLTEVAVELEEANAEVPSVGDAARGRGRQGHPEESEGQQGRGANDGPRSKLPRMANGRVVAVHAEARPVPAVHGPLPWR